jgi:predicted RNA-binding Zn ribbon-like protein
MKHSFHRGSLALDFIGTLGLRRSAGPLERIGGAEEFTRWLREARLLGEGASANEQQRVRAIELREALARIAIALLAEEPPARRDLSTLNAFARETRLGATILGTALEPRRETRAPVPYALAAVASDAVRVFSTGRKRLSRCEHDDCGAFILSNGRGEKRRWCSMESCGNRAKVAAHRKRRSGAARRGAPAVARGGTDPVAHQ